MSHLQEEGSPRAPFLCFKQLTPGIYWSLSISLNRKVPSGFFVGKTVFRMSGKFPERNPTVKSEKNTGGILGKFPAGLFTFFPRIRMSCGSTENTGKENRRKSENRFRRDSRVFNGKVSVYIPDIYGRGTEGMKYVEKETADISGK